MPLPIRKLISLPPAAARDFSAAYPRLAKDWVATSDPPGARLGSGGGLAHLLVDGFHQSHAGAEPTSEALEHWVSEGHILAVLAGGHSRRLPAFAATGKALIPLPPLKDQQGARVDQVLLDLLETPIQNAIQRTGDPRLIVATGDVILIPPEPFPPLTGADAEFVGSPASNELMTRFGVFLADEGRLVGFLQKPTLAELDALPDHRRPLLDVGLWSLSLAASKVLLNRARNAQGIPFELYREFGDDLAKGRLIGDDGRPLSAAVLEWDAGFHHLGSTREFLTMMSQLMGNSLEGWMDEGPSSAPVMVTGISFDDAAPSIPPQTGLDCVPLDGGKWAVRVYGFDDTFAGPVESATLMNKPASEWFARRGLKPPVGEDIQFAPLYPVFGSKPKFGDLQWLLDSEAPAGSLRPAYWASAYDIGAHAEVSEVVAVQRELRANRLNRESVRGDLGLLQYDLAELAQILTSYRSDPSLRELSAIHSLMLESAVGGRRESEGKAFDTLRQMILSDPRITPVMPRWVHAPDALIVARAPARWDLAGGWSDTPPFPIVFGGEVVNVGIDINGGPPIQAFLRLTSEPGILLTSVDLSLSTRLCDESDLLSYGDASDPFGIARAALAIAGFERRFRTDSESPWDSILRQSGIALTLSSALPRGSGLGTSSILGAATLAALSAGFGLNWTQEDLALRTLALEQLLTSGGGWQDQIGGLYPGIKLAMTHPGEFQDIRVFGLPDALFTEPAFASRVLLYNTGITRVAKSVLGEIVRGLFLNSRNHIEVVTRIKENARICAEAVEACDPEAFCASIRESWRLNCLLDSGTCPPEVAAIEARIQPYAAAYKLLGAGGGGFFMIVANSVEDAHRIRQDLESNPPHAQARFYEWSLSQNGLQVAAN